MAKPALEDSAWWIMQNPSGGGAEDMPVEGGIASPLDLGSVAGMKALLKGMLAKRGAKGAAKEATDSIPPMPAAAKEMTDAEITALKDAAAKQRMGPPTVAPPGRAKHIMEDLPPLEVAPQIRAPSKGMADGQFSLSEIPRMTRAAPPIRASDNGLEQIPGNIQGSAAKQKIIEQLLRMQGSTTP